MTKPDISKIPREVQLRGSKAGVEARARKAREKRTEFLEIYKETGTIDRSLAISERTKRWYEVNRSRHPDFKERCNKIREYWAERRKAALANQPVNDDIDYSRGSFEHFRRHLLNTETPRHQQEAVAAYQRVKPGNILMMLWPPEHGKTTMYEDYSTWKLAMDPQWRCSVGAEKQTLSRKIIGRVRNRLEPDGPYPKMVRYYGPFSPHDPRVESKSANRVWGADMWNVVGKQAGDERDWNMCALGIGSQIAGSRCDHLHVDDVTSLNNYTQTERIVETFRQDWLSRPGEWGVTTIAGTRVGIDDFYEQLEDAIGPDILTVIRLPAITYDPEISDYRPLWPERYDMEQLNRMREKVGEDAWSRNYMQQPISKTTATFTDDAIDRCKNPLISVAHHEIPEDGSFICTLDPSIGGVNVWMVIEVCQAWMRPVWIERTHGLVNYDQIFGQLDRLMSRYAANGALCHAVIIEDKAFQAGLINDPRLLAIQGRYGFSIEGHRTGERGYIKHDPDIGIPAIPTAMRRGEVQLPWASDETTQAMMEEFIRELQRWRPHKRGNELEQDQTVAFWFGHLWWQQLRATVADEVVEAPPFTRALPYEPTRMGTMPSGFGSR